MKALATALALQVVFAVSVYAQETRYFYDALGRLIGVVDQEGMLTVYEYDEVGNLLAVRRNNAANGQVAITLVSPGSGGAGTTVEIAGVGFSAVPGENRIAFNGVPAVVLSASRTLLTTSVPSAATSGRIAVTTPSGSAMSPSIFKIPSITLTPEHVTVVVGTTRQFSATVVESTDQRVSWQIDSIDGGNPGLGTINPDGLYTAPADVPVPPVITVAAHSSAFPFLSAESTVAIVPPSTTVLANPTDVRVVLPTIGAGELHTNLTVAAPPELHVVRAGVGDAGPLNWNVTVAGPTTLTLVRPGEAVNGLLPNVTVAQPFRIEIRRP